MNDIFKKVAEKHGVKESDVRKCYNFFFIYLKRKLKETDIYGMTEEDFNNSCHSFRIPKLGRLDVNYKYLKKNQDAYRKYKESKTDIQQDNTDC